MFSDPDVLSGTKSRRGGCHETITQASAVLRRLHHGSCPFVEPTATRIHGWEDGGLMWRSWLRGVLIWRIQALGLVGCVCHICRVCLVPVCVTARFILCISRNHCKRKTGDGGPRGVGGCASFVSRSYYARRVTVEWTMSCLHLSASRLQKDGAIDNWEATAA